MAIDPSNPATLYAGIDPDGVYKSTNGGTSWTAAKSGLTNATVPALAIDPSNPATLYAGTYGGVFKSPNGGSSWTDVNSGLTSTVGVLEVVLALVLDPSNPATLYAGTYDFVYKSTNRGSSWTAENSGLTTTLANSVYAMAIDPSNPSTIYAGTGGGGPPPGVFKSTNGGTSWTAVYSAPTSSTSYTTFYALAIDPSTPATLYAGTYGGGVFKSTDEGSSWTTVNSGLANVFVRTLAIDPSTPATLYAGTGGTGPAGGVFKSTDGGTSWSSVNSGLTIPVVDTLAIDPSNPATLYAGTYGGGVFKSTNGGSSWIAVNSGLTNTYVYTMAIDPSNPATLYAGTYGGGVYTTTDGGTTWQPTGSSASTGPPPPPPAINPGGIVNNASYTLGPPSVAPGSITAIFGTNLTDGTSCLPSACNPTFDANGRLNTMMTGTQVTVNGIAVPIYYSSPLQLGIQIPTDLTGVSATIQVKVNGQSSATSTVSVAPVSPGIFSLTGDGVGAGTITHVDGSVVTPQNPAHGGDVVILYATGLGKVTPSVLTGALPSGQSVTVAPAKVTIGGIAVIPDFTGLASCCVGLNQVNVQVPTGTLVGNNIPVVLSIGGVTSNTVTMAVSRP